MELKKIDGTYFYYPPITDKPRKMEHKLSDILLLTICAVISGAEGWGRYRGFLGETHPDFFEAIW